MLPARPVARLALACTALVLTAGLAALFGARDAPSESGASRATVTEPTRRAPCPVGSLPDRGLCLPVPEALPSAGPVPSAPAPGHSSAPPTP
nr:MAG: hypothetical protein DIU78_20505 [Pseudomonadota bacterium]